MNDSSNQLDLAIIGAGAAGLAAAIFAAEEKPGLRIALLDGASRIGAKILVSGGGRCNVTHDVVQPDDFNAPHHWVKHVLAAFDERRAIKWFASLGVELKREATGKLFPVTDCARTVLEALLNRCEQLGVDMRCGHRVKAIHCIDDGGGSAVSADNRRDACPTGFDITFGHGRCTAKQLIMATGGRSLPKTGSDGSGWRLVETLGHTVTPTHAALAPLVLESSFMHASLSGVSQDVTLSTFVEGKRVDQRTGSLLWTHFGVSGPVVMDASRHWVMAKDTGRRAAIQCSLLPGKDFGAAEAMLLEQANRQPKQPIGKVLSVALPQRVIEGLFKHGEVNATTPMSQLSRETRRRVAHLLTELELPIVKHRGWNYAEVTAGGVPLKEVRFQDMQSKKTPGLYLIGEMLDCDGRIGGFNFQWAWSTGYLAGRGAALSFGGRSQIAGHGAAHETTETTESGDLRSPTKWGA